MKHLISLTEIITRIFGGVGRRQYVVMEGEGVRDAGALAR
jgi:hypothetical protein